MNPRPVRRKLASLARWVVALLLGAIVGVIFHYMLYRFSIPSKPFIYVAF